MTVEWLDGHDDSEADELPQPAPVGPGRRRALWLGGIAVVVAIAVAVVVDASGGAGKGKPKAAGTTPSTNASSTISSSPPSVTPVLPVPSASVSAPTIVEIGHRVLGATSNWELFLHGGTTLYRIEMAAGIMHRTDTPGIDSSGSVSFVVGPTSAILRPFDAVSGYIVEDGKAPRVLSGLLAGGGAIYPGPSPYRVWVEPISNGTDTLAPRLYDLRTQRAVDTGPAAPQTLGQPWMADGSGYLLYGGVGGVYDVRPDGIRRVTTGAVVAAGARSWLVQECDDTYHCTMILIDQATRTRATLGTSDAAVGYQPGSMSPDGRYAAYASVIGGNPPSTHLVDLSTGRDTDLKVSPTDSGSGGTPFVWDPDNDDLLFVDAQQVVRVVDPVTHKVGGLGINLPPIDQLALRPAND